MLAIKVLGPGCDNCHKVHDTVVEALEEMGQEATIEYVSGRAEYVKYGLLFTPGLVINGKLLCGGRLPSKDEVKGWVTAALSA